MSAIYDVYTMAGKSLDDGIREALRAFRARHQCEPAAVWLNPQLPAVDVDGLDVKRGRHMCPWYVYLEVPAMGQPMQPAQTGQLVQLALLEVA